MQDEQESIEIIPLNESKSNSEKKSSIDSERADSEVEEEDSSFPKQIKRLYDALRRVQNYKI